MTDDQGAQGADAQEPAEPAANELTNNDVKNHPLFKKLTSQLAELQNAQNEKLEAEKKAAAEAEIKALEAKGEFEQALKIKTEEIERIKSEHAAQILERDLKTQLFKAGFTNDIFVNGAVMSYDKETPMDEYVQALTENEANKPFLAAQTREPLKPPGKPTVGGGASPLTASQVKELQASDSQEDRQKARNYLHNYFIEHGKMPAGI